MNFKKNWKRFWTLSSAREGFTLVELIVVIAILAILAGVAVPAYSGYVTKANMQADMTLASEVAHALTLYYYAHPGTTGGYVVLNQEGTDSTADAVGAAAMEAVFGAGWEKTAVLKYDGWSDDGLLSYVVANKDSAPLIADSTYLTTATPDSLMGAVNNLTDAATTVIKNYNGDVAAKLASLLDDEFVTNLNNTGVTKDDEEYETVISNMLVGHFAEVLHGASTEEVMQDDGIVGMMISYATLYAYCETIGDTTTMAGIDSYLAQSTSMDSLTPAGINSYLESNCSDEFKAGYLQYNLGPELDGVGGKLQSDVSAALEIMGAVGHIAGTYTDLESLSNANLYSSDSVSQQLDNYIAAVKAVANMDTAALGAISDGSITVFIYENGEVRVVPTAAYLVP